MHRGLFVLFAIGFFAVLSVSAAAPRADDSKGHKVTIKNLKYDPPKLTIKPGETVIWTNKDNNDHTVTADEQDAFKGSDNLGAGDTFQYTFDKKGKFAYHCKYHPRMKGSITVAD
jgi:plastocyanin